MKDYYICLKIYANALNGIIYTKGCWLLHNTIFGFKNPLLFIYWLYNSKLLSSLLWLLLVILVTGSKESNSIENISSKLMNVYESI